MIGARSAPIDMLILVADTTTIPDPMDSTRSNDEIEGPKKGS